MWTGYLTAEVEVGVVAGECFDQCRSTAGSIVGAGSGRAGQVAGHLVGAGRGSSFTGPLASG